MPTSLGHDLPAFAVARSEAARQKLKRLTQLGRCKRVDRGLYLINPSRLSPHHELAAVGVRKAEAIICLESAAFFHGLTSSAPRAVQIGIARSTHGPRWHWPVIEALTIDLDPTIGGIDEHLIEGIPVQITNPARTVAECLKHARTVSAQNFQEILWATWRRKAASIDDISHYATRFGVEGIMTPILQTLLGP